MPREELKRTLESLHEELSQSAEVDPGWLARYAAVEVMRRLIGVAQLPLAAKKTEGSRCGLLEKSRQTMTGGPIDDLF